jgi:hypothetical protein
MWGNKILKKYFEVFALLTRTNSFQPPPTLAVKSMQQHVDEFVNSLSSPQTKQKAVDEIVAGWCAFFVLSVFEIFFFFFWVPPIAK